MTKKQKLTAIANKAWTTRRANAAKRSEATFKANATRKRTKAAKQAWVTRRLARET